MASTDKTHVSSTGDGVVFGALGGFGDVQGTGIDIAYMSQRLGQPGTSGWATRSITPRQEALTLAAGSRSLSPSFEDQFSSDLSRGVYRVWRPLTNAPNVADVPNLYMQTGLNSPAQRSQLLTDSFTPLVIDPNLSLLAKPWVAGASRDLKSVIFESILNLTSDSVGLGPFSPKLYKSDGGVVHLVGRIPVLPETACDDTTALACVPAASSQAGVGASNAFSVVNMISDDGSRVFFQSPTGGAGRLYLRLNGTRTVQINASEKLSPESAQPATLWTAASDGSRAFFTTSEGLVEGDDDDSADLYMYDVSAASGARLSRLSETTVSHSVGTVIGASADGSYVYFTADGQLVGGEPTMGLYGLYVWHEGTLRAIGGFPQSIDASRNAFRTSWFFLQGVRSGRVTPDGRHLLFMSTGDTFLRDRGGFAGYDHGSTCTLDTSLGGPCRELYVYSADSGRLACASCDPRGRTATADALINARDGMGASTLTSHLSHALSDDGRHVFFNTAEPLVPEDSNGKVDAYEYDVTSATIQLVSSGTSTTNSYFLDASPSGDDVFFVTRQRLVGWDGDDNYDLYDARVGGGFPGPALPAPACVGDACQGQSGVVPASGAVGSAVFRSTGNAGETLKARHKKSTRACARRAVARKIRGRVRCVRPHVRHRSRSAIRGERSGK